MKYQFTLNENDYLTHQLFVVSNSKPAIKRRKKGWIITTVFFLFLAVILFFRENQFLGIYFLVAAALSLFFYPRYTKWKYRKHYLRHIRENYTDKFNEKAIVEFTEEHVVAKDDQDSESKISLSQLESFHELKEHFFIKIKGGQTLILPIYKIENSNDLRDELINLSNSLGLSLIDNRDWEWK